MKHAQGGRTNWPRFAVAVTVPTVVAGAMVVGMANGAIAAQFAVSGQAFKISASKLVGNGFTQYGSRVKDANGKEIAVVASGIADATLTDLCQSVRVPGLPVSLYITAGGGKEPVKATNMLINMTKLSGRATFEQINIGQDASTLTGDGRDTHGEQGAFGQQADTVTIENLRQTAYHTAAASFTLPDLSLALSFKTKDKEPDECFVDPT